MNRVRITSGIFTSPKTSALARALRLKDKGYAVTHLIRLWHVVKERSPDGRLDGWTRADIAESARWTNRRVDFTAALLETGWLDVDDDGTLVAHDWEEHQGDGVASAEAT